MYLDGTNYPKAAEPLPQAHVPRAQAPRKAVQVDRDSRPANLSVSPDPHRASGDPHDTFEHVREASGAPATYSSEVSSRASGGQARPLAVPPETEGVSYAAEIVDLETAVNAKGLPLLPEPEGNGVLTQDLLKSVEPADGPGTIVDTAG